MHMPEIESPRYLVKMKIESAGIPLISDLPTPQTQQRLLQ